jgi:type IV pilus assembly protein PilE
MALVVIALLSAVALPAYRQHQRQIRRTDAISALTSAQQLQERWRSSHNSYSAQLGSGGLGLGTVSPAGHYQLAASTAAESAGSSYTLSAEAIGPQSADTRCRHWQISVRDGALLYLSGADATLANDAAENRRCWRQ